MHRQHSCHCGDSGRRGAQCLLDRGSNTRSHCARMVIGKLFGEKRFRQLAQMHIPATFERLLVNAGGQAQQLDRSVGADRHD